MARSETLIVTRPEAVKLLGVSDRHFAHLQAEGLFVPVSPGRGQRGATYDVYQLVPAYLRALQDKDESPRDAREREQAALLRLRREREEGTLWRRPDVERAGRAVLETVKARLRRLGADLVRGGLVPVTGQATVDAAIDEALAELAALRRITEPRG